ncbi:MAG: urease accessory protein UreD [Brucellaceae bacterium]|nr:urease accessory protein UreD [Brucellaceae bacterium]
MADTPAAAMQRVRGEGRLAVRRRDGATVLRTLFQEGAAKIRLPRKPGEAGLEAVLINTAGGLTGGDALRWDVEAGEGTELSLTTQACEKVYRASEGTARADVRLDLGEGARVAWLPQETILFDGASLARTLEVDMAANATLLAVEAAIFGRTARGEIVRDLHFQDRWRIRCAGRLIHGEDQRIDGDALDILARSATAAGGSAVATVLLAGGQAVDRVDAARRLLGAFADVSSGVSAWKIAGTGKLLARLVARDDYALRKALVPLLTLLNGEAPVPKIWSL